MHACLVLSFLIKHFASGTKTQQPSSPDVIVQIMHALNLSLVPRPTIHPLLLIVGCTRLLLRWLVWGKLVARRGSQTGKWIQDPPPSSIASTIMDTQLMTQVIHPTARAFLMPAHQCGLHIFIRADWPAGRLWQKGFERKGHTRYIMFHVYITFFKSQISPAWVGVTIPDLLGPILNAFPDQFYAMGGLRYIVLKYKPVPNDV